MSARDDYPNLTLLIRTGYVLPSLHSRTWSEGLDALDEIDRLRGMVAHLEHRGVQS